MHFFTHYPHKNVPAKWLLIAIAMVNWGWFTGSAQSTKNASNWYFGNNAGIIFNGGTPQALTDGRMRTAEGCAALSDSNGRLLFYTDGSTIWNRNHEIMPGATNLGGSSQSTQSALIVPYQNSTAQFYVFSMGSQSQSTGIQYAVVNTNLGAGLGGLEMANKKMTASSTEKITVINHCNNLNHWIITHDIGTNAFRVFLLNDNGLIPTPTLYRIGSTHQGAKGYIKPSHDGKKLVVAVSDSSQGGFLEVFDFDNKTGVVSNPVKLESAETAGAYGVEFSPDNKLLYLSTMFSKKIYQLGVEDLAIRAVLTASAQTTFSRGIGALQLGPDNKIYGAQPGESVLLAINRPNQSGAGCDLVTQAVSLTGRTAMAGLPFVFTNLPVLPPDVKIALKKLDCCNNFLLESQVVNLDLNYLLYQWYVDGTVVPGINKSTIQPTKSGMYSLKVRETKCQDVQIQSNQVSVVLVDVNPTARALPDSCGAFQLNAHATGGTIQWTGPGIASPRDHLDSLIVSQINGNQTFKVRVNSPDDVTCSSEKEVTVSFTKPPSFQFPTPARSGCGDTLTVRAIPSADWDTFSWQLPDGSSIAGTAVVAHQSGRYQVTAFSKSTGCRSEASQTVTLNLNPRLQLAARQIDTCLATSNSSYLELDAGSLPDVTYSWEKDNTVLGTSQLLKAYAYGSYRISVRTAAGCQTSDSVRLVSNCPPMMPVVSIPDAFTPNQDGLNETLVIYSSGAEKMTLTIYNRWGEPLYTATTETSSPSGWVTWDGTFGGEPVLSGLYTYRLDFKGTDFPDSFIRRGVIQVIR